MSMPCPHPRQFRQNLWGGVAPGRLVFNVRHVILIMQTTLRPAGLGVGAWLSAILCSCVELRLKRSPGSKTCSFLLLQRLRE